MKFTQIPADTPKKLQLNAGILLSTFEPSTATVAASGILGATSGGVTFEATPTYIDFGEDIDNCAKNTKELKQLDTWEVKMSGTYVTVDTELVKSLVGAADVSSTKVTPRNDLKAEDFKDVWWVGDYSDDNGDSGGYMAIRLVNALSTGGFKVKSGDKTKGQFAFEFTGHYSLENPDTVPFEIYIKTGGAE